MTQQERLALAMLRGGYSYDDAAQASGLPVEHVMRLWASDQRGKK